MKKFLSILLCLAMIFTMAACTKNDPPAETTAPENNEQKEPESRYPLEITDQAGRTVTIEKAPEKIVSGYYISTSAIIALDLDSKLVGIEAKAAKREIYKLSAPELIELPSVGSAKEFDLEGCIALEPDLVILPMKLKDAAKSMEDLGIDVILVNPENANLLRQMVAIIASAANVPENAAKLLQYVAETETMLKNTLKDEEKPSVYLAGNSSMLSTAGGSMYQSAMIELAGATNVASEITDTYWVDIDYEQLLTWDPEYIILASDASYTVEDVLADPNLSDCKAVKEGKVYQIPGDAEAWDSPVPAGVLGSVWLASVLHAEAYTAEDANEVINEFYETFYGFKYSEN